MKMLRKLYEELWWLGVELLYPIIGRLTFPKMPRETQRRYDLLMRNRLVRAAIEGGAGCSDATLAKLTDFIHGRSDEVTAAGETFRASLPTPPAPSSDT